MYVFWMDGITCVEIPIYVFILWIHTYNGNHTVGFFLYDSCNFLLWLVGHAVCQDCVVSVVD
jgi:hypothetical protein